MKIPLIFAILIMFTVGAFSQAVSQKESTFTEKPAAVAAETAALDLAKATLAAHGGDKLRAMKSLLVKGSVDVNAMGNAFPGSFTSAFSGDKYYFEIVSPVQQLKQVYDGKKMFSSVPEVALPPVTNLGFPVLSHIGDAGFVVSAVADNKKKAKGFRVTTPEGFVTDFYIDEKTKQIKSYECSYELATGQVVTTSVEIDQFETVDGVVAPKKYSQRFQMGPVTAYISFSAKRILVNSPFEDSAFAVPK